ncbi:hypothetical protein BH23GEM10_BH23GEM10_00420 [soil metagenome]
MRSAVLLLALSTAAGTGCAAFTTDRGPDPATQLHEGVIALDAGEYARARAILDPLYQELWAERVGQHAALALVAADIDVRNPSRSLWSAADRAARLLNVPGLEPWMVPVIETYYVLALELGAQEERMARAESALAEQSSVQQANQAAGSGRMLPQAPSTTVPARIGQITGQRDALQRRLGSVEQELAARDLELKETKAELERIKRTIRP